MVILLLAACAPPGGPSAGAAGTWVGTISTEGGVTTVVNEAGSVWGGPVTLVEDLSIGVETGEEPYMFGPIAGLAATDERIYVADDLGFRIRVYDHDGRHLFDFGREGEGPGEFAHIQDVTVDPDGRVFVLGPARVTVFDLDGQLLDTWSYRSPSSTVMTTAIDGTLYVPGYWVEDDQPVVGLVAVAPDGTEIGRVTALEYDPMPWSLVARAGGRTTGATVLYAPRTVLAVLPSGALVRGISEAYRFTVQRADGTSLIIERAGELPAVPPELAEWYTIQRTDVMRRVQPDWQWTVNPVPAHKPAFTGFAGDRNGRIWVTRALGTETITDCDPDPLGVEGRRAISCWRDVVGLDVFEERTGRLLGQIEPPHALSHPVFLEDAILTAYEDEAGTIMVKRYRLQMPGEAR
jgi:sugar lactone lactonase YvrE